jgi:hypothetical protein
VIGTGAIVTSVFPFRFWNPWIYNEVPSILGPVDWIGIKIHEIVNTHRKCDADKKNYGYGYYA